MYTQIAPVGFTIYKQENRSQKGVDRTPPASALLPPHRVDVPGSPTPAQPHASSLEREHSTALHCTASHLVLVGIRRWGRYQGVGGEELGGGRREGRSEGWQVYTSTHHNLGKRLTSSQYIPPLITIQSHSSYWYSKCHSLSCVLKSRAIMKF